MAVSQSLESAAAVINALRKAERVTAICHENPDADTVGAAIAICLIAEIMGKEAEIVSVDTPSVLFDFLPRMGQVRRSPGLEPDTAVVCDAASLARVGRSISENKVWLAASHLVNIDHHATNTFFGAVNHVDPTAAATCQLVAELLPDLGIQPDAQIATALLTGIVRDSNGFSDANTSPSTLRTAANLMDAGASVSLVHRKILAELPLSTMTLWGQLLTHLQQRFDGRVVFTVLRMEMLEATGTKQDDADGIAEFITRSQGAQVSLLLRELGPSETRASIRTVEPVDATAIAARFGGGGHARRAGCTMSVPLPMAIEVLVAACGAALSEMGTM